MSQKSLGVLELERQKDPPHNARKPRAKWPFLAGILIVFVTALVWFQLRSSRRQAPGQGPIAKSEMAVTVVHPQKTSITIPVLPGQTEAYTDAPIYAQTSGYLQKWYFDIGAKVKAGDVLAEIDTPEVDEELAQAQAQLKMAQAALNLADVTFRRDQDLYNRKVIAVEDMIQLLTPIARTRQRFSQTRRTLVGLTRSKRSKSSERHSTGL
jgi:multidrug efflux pump subunit AcrA (membrane-fusion protein)